VRVADVSPEQPHQASPAQTPGAIEIESPRGRFVWSRAEDGAVLLTRAQLSMLLEGIDWRRPERTADGVDEAPRTAA
jgi:hypothetical protein